MAQGRRRHCPQHGGIWGVWSGVGEAVASSGVAGAVLGRPWCHAVWPERCLESDGTAARTALALLCAVRARL